MSLKFNGTTDRASIALPGLTGAKGVCISCWFWWDAYAGDNDLLMEFSTDSNTNQGFFINPNGPLGTFDVSSGDGTRNYARRYDRANFPAARWNHLFLNIWYPDPSQRLFANGGPPASLSEVANSGTTPPLTSTTFTNNTLYLLHRDSGPTLLAAGKIAELAIFRMDQVNEYLYSEVARPLYEGKSPHDIRRGSELIAYHPLDTPYDGQRSRVPYHASPLRIASGTSPAPNDMPIVVGGGGGSTGFGVAEVDDIEIGADAATVLIDIQVSSDQVFEAVDQNTVLVDIQVLSTEAYIMVESATIYVEISNTGGECYSTFSASQFGEGEATLRWVSDSNLCWSSDYNLRWTARASVAEGINC